MLLRGWSCLIFLSGLVVRRRTLHILQDTTNHVDVPSVSVHWADYRRHASFLYCLRLFVMESWWPSSLLHTYLLTFLIWHGPRPTHQLKLTWTASDRAQWEAVKRFLRDDQLLPYHKIISGYLLALCENMDATYKATSPTGIYLLGSRYLSTYLGTRYPCFRSLVHCGWVVANWARKQRDIL